MNQNVASYPSVLGVPDCIEERVNFEATLAQVVGSSARWSSFVSRYQSGIVTGSAFLTRPLPRYVSRVRNDRIYTATLVQATPSAPLAGRATISYRYLISENRNWRTLFPNLDFLMCPILQGIRDADLDQGREIENIAGSYPVTLTTSSRYLYPDKRLVRIDNDGWLTYNVDGVEKYGRIWSRHPYNMLGCMSYPSNGHYCVSVVYEDDVHEIFNGNKASGVEIADNTSGNAYNNYTFKRTETNIRQIGVNATNRQWNVGNNQSGICVIIFNVDIDAGEPAKTYVFQRNITTSKTFVDTTRTDAAIASVPVTRSTYFRCISNNQGRVKWFGIMRGTQDDATIEVLKHYLISFASS